MIGERRGYVQEEISALRLGLDLGMTHIDTAEMYGNGCAEKVVGNAIKGRREEVFLASKVLPSDASYQGTIAACERSLKRLQTDYLDLYLLNFLVRNSGVFTIPKTVRCEHVQENAAATCWVFSEDDVRRMDDVFQPPQSETQLAVI